MFNIPSDRWYTRTHEWVKTEDGDIAIGVTDFAQNAMSDIVYVDLPDVGTELSEGAEMCTLESVKSVSPLYAPRDGVIIEVNRELEDAPEMVNGDPYGAWIVRMSVDGFDDGVFLDADEYAKICADEEVAK